MASLPRAGSRLATLILCALLATPATAGLHLDPDPRWRHAEDLHALVEIFEDWLDDTTPWKRRETPASVRIVSEQDLRSVAGSTQRSHGRTRGLYHPESRTIYLGAPWDPRKAADASVLLHELVHHRQAPHHWYCQAAQEEAAYRLQDEWLKIRGLSADVNWIAVTLEAGCTPRDIHPD